MNALNDFVVAAGSYFGLPEGRVAQGSTINVDHGTMELVLCITLTSDEVVGIGKRMEAMAQLERARSFAGEKLASFDPPSPTRKDLLVQLYHNQRVPLFGGGTTIFSGSPIGSPFTQW